MKKQEFELYLKTKVLTNHSYICTGFKLLDELVDGFYPGTVWVIGGWPGTGKTTTIMNLAANLRNTKIVLFDTESTKYVWTEKFVSLLSSIPYKDIRTNLKDNLPIILSKLDMLNDYDIEIIDNDSPSLSMIEQTISKYNPKIVVIDYIQNVDVEEGKFSSRYAAYTYVVKQLERLAKAHKTTIILCSQLRKPTSEQVQPTLFDLKETGKLGESAHVVILVRKHDEGLAFNVVKSRNGLLGEFILKGNWLSNKLT